ncbi:MAG: TetR/AcrR family transcriptional repressor of nem operon [Gammaproteobacteria bacterium]
MNVTVKPTPGRPRGYDAQAILATVMQLFYEHGYNGTSSRMLQQATGLTAPSLYNGFGSKRDLFLAALKRYIDMTLSYLFVDLANGTRGIDDLEVMLDQLWIAIEGPERPLGCLVLNTRGEFGTSEADILAICDEFTGRQSGAIRDAFSRAADLGEIPHDSIERRVLAFRLMLNGVQNLSRTNGMTQELRDAYAALRMTLQEWRQT